MRYIVLFHSTNDGRSWSVRPSLTGGNREEARMLGIGERTLYRKIKEYGL